MHNKYQMTEAEQYLWHLNRMGIRSTAFNYQTMFASCEIQIEYSAMLNEGEALSFHIQNHCGFSIHRTSELFLKDKVKSSAIEICYIYNGGRNYLYRNISDADLLRAIKDGYFEKPNTELKKENLYYTNRYLYPHSFDMTKPIMQNQFFLVYETLLRKHKT
jgi:hypothetical protein